MGTWGLLIALQHTHTHARTMFALQSQIAGAKVVSKVVAKKQQRSTVVSAKISHGKGGEEGGRSFNNDAFGMICKAASYSMMGNAITASGEEGTFTQEGPITVFAADDDAFGDFIKTKGVSKMDFVKMDGLGDIVKNHVVKGTLPRQTWLRARNSKPSLAIRSSWLTSRSRRTTSRSTTPRSTPSRRSSSKQDYGINISFIIKQYFDTNIWKQKIILKWTGSRGYSRV